MDGAALGVTAPPTTEAQIRATVIDLIEKYPRERVFGIRAEPRWAGADVVHIGHRPVRIVPCVSSLAARQVLIGAEGRTEHLVLLIDREPNDLGDDVLARLARRRLFSLDPWETLRGLFRAQNVDPALAGETGIAGALIEAVPSGGFPAAPGGFLTADLAWGTLVEQRLGLPREPTLADLLAWAEDEHGARAWNGLAPAVRGGLRRWLDGRFGPVARAVMDLVEGERGVDALPLGLAMAVVFCDSPVGEQERALARVRLEGLLAVPLPAAAARAWSDESERLVRERLISDGSRARPALGRGERLLEELGAIEHAHLSDLLERGFDQRLVVVAEAAERCAHGGGHEELASALTSAERHAMARLDPARARAARMAVRVARWLADHATAEPPPSFEDAAICHSAELGFVDWARRALWGGDRHSPVAAAYERLTERADTVRRSSDQRFADLLRGWLRAGASADRVVLLEQVIARVIAPIAAAQPVLVLVADGMSVDVAHELVEDLVRRGWTELAPEGAESALTGVACLPTVTEACRTSLLSGELLTGDSGREKRRFAAHQRLTSVSAPSAPPVLFHRGDITPQGAHRLPEDVRRAVEDPRRRVVGAVVNAVDDLLMKGGQIRPLWTSDAVPVLGALLESAVVGERVVVLVSDHGHVTDRDTPYRAHEGGGGERWRAAVGAPATDEVLLEGSLRILLGDGGRVIAAATERIRYSKSPRDGYHGGATSREVIVPIRVLRAPFAAQPAGWHEIPTVVPDWWDGAPATGPGAAAQEPPARPASERQQSLFDPRPAGAPEAGDDWIAGLFTSEAYRQQIERLGARGRLENARVRALLIALDARGGTSTTTALARAAQVPEARMNGVLAAMQRLLNVDGYPVVSTTPDGETVIVNVGLLRDQFGL